MILSRSRPGTRLWIIDLDPDYTVCKPDHPAFRAFTDFVSAFCERHSVEIRIGRMLPLILEEAGFQVLEVAVEPFDNREIEPALLAEYLDREAMLYDRFMDGSTDPEKIREMKQFFFNEMNPEKHYVRYGMAMICAVKSQV